MTKMSMGRFGPSGYAGDGRNRDRVFPDTSFFLDMSERILFIDDEPNFLSSLQRQLRERFDIELAVGAQFGLQAISTQGPYAVVVSDLRMPGVDGIGFLAKVKECSPDSVRIMLTGQADLEAAIHAVNEGNIFRFLTKPCPMEVLMRSLEAALAQYRLITAERELLEKTLVGSVTVLVEILSLVQPAAFGKGLRMRHYVRQIATEMNLPNRWQFEIAAMLSQIGCISVPLVTLDKVRSGRELSADERAIVSSHPIIGARLLKKIPRLESIAEMVEWQQKPFCSYAAAGGAQKADLTAVGARMLRVVTDLDDLLSRGFSNEKALEEMRGRADDYDPGVLAALERIRIGELPRDMRSGRMADVNTLVYQNAFW